MSEANCLAIIEPLLAAQLRMNLINSLLFRFHWSTTPPETMKHELANILFAIKQGSSSATNSEEIINNALD
jgi:hypothetical protein